ncbi:unnamed protein product, partial [Oppiella nova]
MNDTNEEIIVATDDNTRDGSESETKTKANVVLFNKTTGSTKQVVKSDNKIVVKSVKLFVCQSKGCEKHFFNKRWFEAHMKTHSSEAINGSDKSRKQLLEAIQRQKRFKCNVKDCGKQFAYKVELNNHSRTHISKTIRCLDTNCEFVTEDKTQLIEHMDHMHSITLTICDFESCGELFTNKELFTSHVKQCHKTDTEMAATSTT